MSGEMTVNTAGGEYRLLACDLDGTLLANHGRMSQRAFIALERAHSAGMLVVISTGRTLTMIPRKIRRLRCVDAFITSNGARVVLRGGETLSMRPVPQQAALGVLLRLKEQGAAVNAFYNGKALFDRCAFFSLVRSGERLSLDRIGLLLRFLGHSCSVNGIRRRIRKKGTAVEKIGGMFKTEDAAIRALSEWEADASLTAVTTAGAILK
jgi:hypothetical protein